MKIQVKKGGPLTTLQDLGRNGYQKYGVIVSGAMDQVSLRLGNLLVGNKESEGALEMTLSGPALKVPAGLVFAITGADLQAKLGGSPVPRNRAIYVKQDGLLTFGFAQEGCRGYLTVAGGFAVPEVMGSKSTYLRAKLGGVEGRPLQSGDELETGALNEAQEALSQKLAKLPGKDFSSFGWSIPETSLFSSAPIRVAEGLQYDWFKDESVRTFFTTAYTITPEADRMGYRMDGEKLEYKEEGKQLISEPVTFGSIQVPADGKPIVLMADCQTTGGYPKIGQVIQADLPRLGQMKPGQRVYFQLVNLAEAEKALARQEKVFQEAEKMVKF